MDHAAPPTAQSVPDFGVTDEPPRWPTVVGTISIVYAGLMLSCTGCGVGFLFLAPSIMGAAANQPGGLPPSMQPTPMMIASSAASFAWFLVLLTAGILLVTRSARSRALHLVWAGGALLLLAWGFVIQAQMRTAMQQWVQQNPDSPFAQPSNPGMELAMAVGMSMLMAAWPVFCLIWFGTVKRTAASMTGQQGGAE